MSVGGSAFAMVTSRDTGSATPDRSPGELALVLHTHLPHLAGHGVWPVGEEWLLQAWGTSWLPVTRTLERLADAGHRELLTLSVTPTTAWQLADPGSPMSCPAGWRRRCGAARSSAGITAWVRR
jgi:hypothetical protein